MVRKKVDQRVRILIENGIKERHRSMFFIIGDKGRDQVVNLHYILSKSLMKSRPSVLWCYQKELGFTSNRIKRAKTLKRDIKRGIRQAGEENPFELFVSSTDIRYTYYKETHKILGNTYGMCILQDFHALTPNLLARTIETVEGGGVIIFLLKTMKSLKQLYTMTMDVHSRYRTEAQQDIVGRFNERFLLSLASNERCLVVDDELNVLPISSHIRNIKKLQISDNDLMDSKGEHIISQEEKELNDLKDAMRDTQPIGSLVNSTKTLDQAKALLTFVEAIQEKTLRSTVTLTAARGRGKSAAMGIAIAAAVSYGYANIFVTAPSPENVKTLFQMILLGFDAIEYKEHLDYDIVQSNNPEFNKAIIRINIFREHRQTIQYILPQDYKSLGQAELLVVDEAAAIPLTVMKRLLGNYLVFMSSTVNGYEGTGRSLSLKLIADLRRQSVSGEGRTLREIEMNEPIRYGVNDSIEKWLNDLLCLDCNSYLPRLVYGMPHPNQCELYYVNKDTLFSYHKSTEIFLQKIMALFVASHYKNTPNDLQLLSDAPAHHIFVLLGPVTEDGRQPDILAAIQVALEGGISKQSSRQSLARGQLKSGDLIPWTIVTQYQDPAFAGLSGARIVRIAVHPDIHSKGYGSRALEQLTLYFNGQLTGLKDINNNSANNKIENKSSNDDETTLLDEVVKPRKTIGHLLEKLDERKPEILDYLGVSYGMTLQLFNFWRRIQFQPIYIRQTCNSLTGEHSCIMLKTLSNKSSNQLISNSWLNMYSNDFQRRFLSLLPIAFTKFSPVLGLSILSSLPPDNNSKLLTYDHMMLLFNELDLTRLESYSRNLVDYHLILDLIPTLARLYFTNSMDLTLSYVQSSILVALGLQYKSVSEIELELNLPSHQILAIFNKMIRKISKFLRQIESSAVKTQLEKDNSLKVNSDNNNNNNNRLNEPLRETLDEEMKQGAKLAIKQLKTKQYALPEHDLLDNNENISSKHKKKEDKVHRKKKRRKIEQQSLSVTSNDNNTTNNEDINTSKKRKKKKRKHKNSNTN